MKVLFLHGWHSVVGGVKPSYLSQAGCDVINPPLDDDDFEAAVRTAQAAYDQHQPQVIVGSSRGGAVALNIDSGDTPLVLLCPAWRNWGSVTTIKSNCLILHSRADDVIPFEDSERLLLNSGLSPESLLEVGHDHRLADPESLAVLLWACRVLAAGETLPGMAEESAEVAANIDGSQAGSQAEGSYLCDACGEEIVVPLDLTAGTNQSYVEDCPVCCRANTIHVQIDDDGQVSIWAEPESP